VNRAGARSEVSAIVGLVLAGFTLGAVVLVFLS
jgi:hypothetical protein